MIDQNEVLPTTEPLLTPEQIAKTDKDIATLSALSDYAASRGSVFEISGGYALEAHFGGKITRSHGDMDAVMWLSNANAEDKVKNEISSVLFEESTPWTEYPNVKNRQHFIEYREVAPEKRFFDNRRLELYIFDRKRMRPLVEKILIDSEGREHKIMVTTTEELVADKVRIFNRSYEEKQNKRATIQTDIDEFGRIIQHPDFSQEKYFRTMTSLLRFNSQGTLTEEQALQRAEIMWNNAMKVIGETVTTN